MLAGWRSLIRLGLASLALALGACGGPVESRVALSEPGSAAFDPRILGDWYATENDFTWHLGIEARADSAVLDIVGTGLGYSDGRPVRWLTLAAHATVIDGGLYYNVQRTAGIGDDYGRSDTPPGFIIARASLVDDERLEICFLDESRLNALIENGALEGREIEGVYGVEDVPYLLIDAPRERLVALIRETSPGDLFDCAPDPLRRLPPTDGE